MKGIDIVVGGQFGDEGKGQICAQLARDAVLCGRPYKFAVRVGGSNAEHRFATPDDARHTGRVLPVAGWVDRSTKLVLGAGHIIKLDSFFNEVAELEAMYGPQTERIFIDPQAGVINTTHVQAGEDTAWRGSTHQGSGQAAAHKVLRDGTFKTADMYPELKKHIKGDTAMAMRGWLLNGEMGMLEGSQGALLTLNHGYYPFCTSKEVTPAGVLAEAGISIGWVRNIWAVYRTVFMRVPGNSGPSEGQEITWEMLEEATGLRIPEKVKRQTDSPDHRERIFLWSWQEFEKSIALVGPTHMALTFADWFPRTLVDYTMKDLVEEMQKRAGCPVSIIRTGPAWNDYRQFPVGRYAGQADLFGKAPNVDTGK